MPIRNRRQLASHACSFSHTPWDCHDPSPSRRRASGRAFRERALQRRVDWRCWIFAPAQHSGTASTARDTGYHLVPRPRFQVATTPARPSSVPVAPRTSACFIGFPGASLAVSQAAPTVMTSRYELANRARALSSGLSRLREDASRVQKKVNGGRDDNHHQHARATAQTDFRFMGCSRLPSYPYSGPGASRGLAPSRSFPVRASGRLAFRPGARSGSPCSCPAGCLRRFDTLRAAPSKVEGGRAQARQVPGFSYRLLPPEC